MVMDRANSVENPAGFAPKAPITFQELDISESVTTELMVRRLYMEDKSDIDSISRSLRLSFPVVHSIFQRLREQQLIEVTGMSGNNYSFCLTSAGRELADRLRTDKPELKVVFSSGYSPEIAGMDLAERKGNGFLQKPYSSGALLEKLRAVLNSPDAAATGHGALIRRRRHGAHPSQAAAMISGVSTVPRFTLLETSYAFSPPKCPNFLFHPAWLRECCSIL